MSEDRHRCLAGSGCGSSVVEDGVKQPAHTEAPDSLCEGCIKSLDRVIGELPEMWISLELALGDKGQGQDQRVSGTRVPPIPLSVTTAAVMDSLVEWVSAGASRVAEMINTTDPSPASRTTQEQGQAIVDGCRLLRTNLDRLLESESDTVSVWLGPKETGRPGETWTDSFGNRRGIKLVDMTGIDIGLEIQRQHRLGRAILGHTQPRQRQPLPCPLCSSATVYRTVRTIRGKVFDEVNCDSCGRGGSYDWFQRMVGVALHHIEEERVTEDERIEAWLSAKALYERSQVAEWIAAKTTWQLSLLLDPAVAGLPVETFAREILGLEAA